MLPQVIKLNVGGTYFATTRQNLSRVPGTFLARLASEEASREGLYLDGALFIDRDPDVFSLVLNWLRGCRPAPDLELRQCEQLIQEANFYGLLDLANALEVQKGPQPALAAAYKLQLVPRKAEPLSLQPFEPGLGLLISCITGQSAFPEAAPRLIHESGANSQNALFQALVMLKCATYRQWSKTKLRVEGSIQSFQGPIKFEASLDLSESDQQQLWNASRTEADRGEHVCGVLRQSDRLQDEKLQLARSIVQMAENMPALILALGATPGLSGLKCTNLSHSPQYLRNDGANGAGFNTTMQWTLSG
ncbi:hypothetical protein WJX74_005381 [Apatococcus lobatus]|uniref:BTB domain-containing protein n=1 Tax=Apatococcus lobatus TaxID=904363 RepID=A0AAW1S3F2_9CHLO